MRVLYLDTPSDADREALPEVRGLAAEWILRYPRPIVFAQCVFEHGQWWVILVREDESSDIRSVVETSEGLDLEEL
jgi:hypothetical protein